MVINWNASNEDRWATWANWIFCNSQISKLFIIFWNLNYLKNNKMILGACKTMNWNVRVVCCGYPSGFWSTHIWRMMPSVWTLKRKPVSKRILLACWTILNSSVKVVVFFSTNNIKIFKLKNTKVYLIMIYRVQFSQKSKLIAGLFF